MDSSEERNCVDSEYHAKLDFPVCKKAGPDYRAENFKLVEDEPER